MRRHGIVGALVVLILSPILTLAAEVTDQQLLTQTQAADIMSSLLTVLNDLSEARVKLMHSYLQQLDREADFAANPPTISRKTPITYDQALRGAIAFVQDGNAKYADPALTKLSRADLQKEFDQLQQYNMATFLEFNDNRIKARQLRAYLESIKQFDGYLEFAKHQMIAPAPATTPATMMSSQDMTAWLDWLAKSSKEQAWAIAQKDGMTREQFEKRWESRKQDARENVESGLQCMRDLAQRIATALEPQNTNANGPTNASGWATYAGNAPRNSSRPPVASPLTRTPAGDSSDSAWTTRYKSDPSSFSSWDDDYSDVFTYSGKGTWATYDPRINNDTDRRVNGEVDRRLNSDTDRRTNMHIDFRANIP